MAARQQPWPDTEIVGAETSKLMPHCDRSARLHHEGPRGSDFGADRIGTFGERNRGGIVLPRLGQIAGLLRRLRRAKRGAEAVRFFLQRRLLSCKLFPYQAVANRMRGITGPKMS